MCFRVPVAPVERTRVREQGLSDLRIDRVCSMDIFCMVLFCFAPALKGAKKEWGYLLFLNIDFMKAIRVLIDLMMPVTSL